MRHTMIIIDFTYNDQAIQRFESEAYPIIIGRTTPAHTVDLDLTPDNSVSRNHARLSYESDMYWLEDLGSTYGTWINGHKITHKTRLRSDDQVQIGATKLDIRVLADGILTSSISAAETPSDLLLSQKSSLKSMRRRLTAFYELGSALGTIEGVEPLLKTVVEHLCKVIPDAQRGALLLNQDGALQMKACYPPLREPPISLNLARLAITKNEAYIWRHGTPGVTGELFDSVIRHGTQSAMYAPLVSKDEVLGVVFVDSFASKDAFNDDDLRLVMAMTNQTAIFVKNHMLQQDLRSQEVIRSNLLRQFSPQVAERLETLLKERNNLRLGGERAEPVTILTTDVRGFTALTARMEPKEVVEMLNDLFGVCIPIIFKYNGSVDKYVGDAILAVFGSPEPDDNQWEHAVKAALEMQQAIQTLGERRERNNLPICRVGIGIHTGAVLHGFIGAEERMEYTVIGDTVNRASRYCDGADSGQVIISDEVFEHVKEFIEATPTTVISKNPDTEESLSAYIINAIKEETT
ncbi:MAG: adenylate/guanylate cyclase domain-containing protein [Chloroflexota bacterium]